MQLFITSYFNIIDNKIIIDDKRIFNQLRKVLRAGKWFKFAVQNNWKRYYVIFDNFNWWTVNWFIEKEEILKYKFRSIWIATAFLNKQSKMEWICQKLTELWVERIIFFWSSRSVLNTISNNKINRMKKIILEAAEQAWLSFIPKLEIYKNIEELIDSNKLVEILVADFEWQFVKNKIDKDNLIVLVWPEGWWSDEERKMFKENKFEFIKLWNTILRSETASIISWWLIV